jgi:Xaa-Pro dipeptidase
MQSAHSQARRREVLREKLRATGMDAAAINPGGTFVYLTGASFALMERPTVFFLNTNGLDCVVLPHLELESWAHLGIEAEVFAWRDEEGYAEAFAKAARHCKARQLGVEPLRLRLLETRALEKAFAGCELVAIDKTLSDLRAIKDEEEIAALEASVNYSEEAFEATLAAIRPGMTEIEIQHMLMQRMLDTPGSGDLVAPLVLTGIKSALPHGHADSTPVKAGDPLLFDFAIRSAGYTCDITRTVFVGHASAEHRAFYAAVKTASDLALASAKPGVSAGELDNIVRGSLEAGPFAQWVLHKTGHGIGLDVHEAPQIMRGNSTLIEPGHVLALEPGLYRTGDIGVRIEDNVVITETGCRCLTKSTRDLRIVAENLK